MKPKAIFLFTSFCLFSQIIFGAPKRAKDSDGSPSKRSCQKSCEAAKDSEVVGQDPKEQLTRDLCRWIDPKTKGLEPVKFSDLHKLIDRGASPNATRPDDGGAIHILLAVARSRDWCKSTFDYTRRFECERFAEKLMVKGANLGSVCGDGQPPEACRYLAENDWLLKKLLKSHRARVELGQKPVVPKEFAARLFGLGDPKKLALFITYVGVEARICILWLLNVGVGYYSPITNSSEKAVSFWGFHFGVGI